jgi:hypothetical protein
MIDSGTVAKKQDKPPEPVFLHGAWRSGSTYYWSRFRALPETMAFYEPLHHGLAKLTTERIARAGVETTVANGHCPLTAPYFAEFGPMISSRMGRTRGVKRYRSDFAHGRFNLHRNEAHPGLERYLGGLIDYAHAQGKRPVLGCNRTCGKVGWIKSRFGSYDVYIDRDPAAVWASYEAERIGGNYTFFSMWLRVLEANRSDPMWGPLAERLGVSGGLRARFTSMKTRHRAIIDDMGPAETYLLTFYAWMACASQALGEADLVIDDALAPLPHYADKIAERIGQATGLAIDLSGLEARPPRVIIGEGLRRRVEQEALSHFPRIAARPQSGLRRQLKTLSNRKADLIAALI